jgi:hypothetical protein
MYDTHVRLFVEELHDRTLPAVVGLTPLEAAIPIVVQPPITAIVATPNLTLTTATPFATINATTDFSAQLTAGSIASRSALSSAHQVGVENDLSPLAQAPEGIVMWESPDSFAFPR